jgi:hypothetical protein
MNVSDRSERKPRGIRLTDLDRTATYRIGYVVERRRWEVLGRQPDAVEREAGGPDALVRKRSADSAPASGRRFGAPAGAR